MAENVSEDLAWRRALLLHHAGTDVQDIFSTLDYMGGPKDYAKAVDALNNCFVPQVNTVFARQSFYRISEQWGDGTAVCNTFAPDSQRLCFWG